MEGARSCPCGNVEVASDGTINVQFIGLLESRREPESSTTVFVCGNCGVATHSVGADGKQVVRGEGLVNVAKGAGSLVFGVRVKVSDQAVQAGGAAFAHHDAKVERLLERYRAKVKEEARAKIEQAELEARTLLAKMAVVERKNKPLVAGAPPPSSLPEPARRRKSGPGLKVTFAEPAVERRGVAAGATMSKSLPAFAKSPLLDSLWAMDEELDEEGGPAAAAAGRKAPGGGGGGEERAFPDVAGGRRGEEDEDEDIDLKSSDPLLPTSRRILFGSQDPGGGPAPSAGLAMAHSLPVEVPAFRRKKATPSLEEGETEAEEGDGPFVRPDVLAANTWKEQVRSDWVAQTRLGRDEDLEFLVATQGSDLKARKKTLV